ncbi:unnamed protein product [Rotaria sp. Silwood2]|nr:unnamed protein product [Rotaria sp. Silwood2]
MMKAQVHNGGKYAPRNVPVLEARAVQVKNIPRFITERELEMAFNKFFDNSVATVEITLDIGNISTGVGYVVFRDTEYRDKCLDSQKNDHFIFLTSKIWNGPLFIKPYSSEGHNFFEQEQEQEQGQEEKENFLPTMTNNNQMFQLANDISRIYIENEKNSNESLKKSMNELRRKTIMKEIKNIQDQAEKLQEKADNMRQNLKRFAPNSELDGCLPVRKRISSSSLNNIE